MYCPPKLRPMEKEYGKTQESILEENQFLKMKMMLEHGPSIQFGGSPPPALENAFLKHIMEFENRLKTAKSISIFEKIGNPNHFKPSGEIPIEEMELELEKLMTHLYDHGISVGCCSPKVSDVEMYRFIVEELFEKEITDVCIPGQRTHFIYDDFHPDHEYDNTRSAVDDCLGLILNKDEFSFSPAFEDHGLQLNDHKGLTREEFFGKINQFKSWFDDMYLLDLVVEGCIIEDKSCTVKGKFELQLVSATDNISIANHWSVDSKFIDECGYWYINNVQLRGLNF
jgi:hypothetical protein